MISGQYWAVKLQWENSTNYSPIFIRVRHYDISVCFTPHFLWSFLFNGLWNGKFASFSQALLSLTFNECQQSSGLHTKREKEHLYSAYLNYRLKSSLPVWIYSNQYAFTAAIKDTKTQLLQVSFPPTITQWAFSHFIILSAPEKLHLNQIMLKMLLRNSLSCGEFFYDIMGTILLTYRNFV